MSNFLRQSTASQSRSLGPFIDSTDFVTAATGLTIANTDIKLVVNGAASANKNSGGGTHRVNGNYGVTFDATDTATVGEMEVSVKVAGALQVFKTFYVVEEAVFDALFVASAPGYGTAQTGDSYAVVNSGTSGNAALKTLIDTLDDFVDTEVAAIKTKTDFLPSATAGAAGGLFIAGSNAATSITTALTANVIGNITGNLSGSVGSVTGAVGSVGAGGIAASSFAAGAIDAAAIATDAIDADALKTDAVTEIQSGLSTLNAAGVRSAVGLASANLDTQIGTLATASNLATVAGYLDTEIAAILADTNELQTDWVNGGRLDLILDARASQTSVDDLPTNAELAAALDPLPTAAENADAVWDEAIAGHLGAGSTGEALSDAGGAGTPPTVTEIGDELVTRELKLIAAYDFAKGSVAMTESYAAQGATMTPVQALHMLWSLLNERGIVSTTLTARKLDGTTPSMTFTLDDAVTPTDQTRAT